MTHFSVLASAEGFYPKYYRVAKDSKVRIDLDKIPDDDYAIVGMLRVYHSILSTEYYRFLPDAEIHFLGSDGTVTSAVTDEDGRFGLKNLPPVGFELIYEGTWIDGSGGMKEVRVKLNNGPGVDFVILTTIQRDTTGP